MTVQPSTTGDDPLAEVEVELEDESHALYTDEPETIPYSDSKSGARSTTVPVSDSQTKKRTRGAFVRPSRRTTTTDQTPQRKLTRQTAKQRQAERRRQQELEKIRPPSLWNVYCGIVTFWCPDVVLRCFGMPARAQRRAWREKMGLISLIILLCTFVGFLTFGFTRTVCLTNGVRLKVNHVDAGYMIFHGQAYNLADSQHPAADGIPVGANVLYDLPHKYGGQDGSFFFQNVNGACKGMIKTTENSTIPTGDDGNELAWYFPCTAFNQDGSSSPNFTDPYYLGYACHTTAKGRNTFYKLHSSGDVYFTWDDLKNSSRNLAVYAGDVLDLDLINWLDTTQVTYPDRFNQLRDNSEVRGVDITRAFQSTEDRKIGQCLSEIIKVGSIDTESVGCIASKVVLYVSLVFILSIVVVKFVMALIFRWFVSPRLAAQRSGLGAGGKKRSKEIEDWTEDIYRPAPRLGNMGSAGDRASKRTSILPTTSRFTSPYALERGAGKERQFPTTMASQSSSANLVPSTSYRSSYGGGQGKLGISSGPSRSSEIYSDPSYFADTERTRPADFIHDAVVPQPPTDWQPFGYPLAHTICLVTAYSEGEAGIRTTLNSVATTEYPNSHKCILVICDGLIKGAGEKLTTPEIVLDMMGDHAIPPEEVQAFSYVAVASGTKRHNMAKIYSGFYDYGTKSSVPISKQQRVPMMVIVKCGTPDEASKSKPGNRGKRDSQIILMSFLQKVMFDERMTQLEYEMFNGLWKITGISPDFYECVLMVDADTKVFPDSLTHMVSAMVQDPDIMGLCGETKIANKRDSWVTMIQVFEYFISHHQAKSFESIFGGVTCLPGCFSMYRIKAPKGGQNYWVPILANPDVVEHYSENVVDTLHKKNLLLLGEDRYLSTLMLKTFPKRKQIFVPQAVCKTTVPDQFSVLLSQRRRWINSTVHNLMELVLVRDLCGTFCFSMQFVVFIELVGTTVLPAAISFTLYVLIASIIGPVQVIPLILLGLILGLPAVLIVITASSLSYVGWMFIYLASLPIWNFVLPTYAFWKFDDFSWGDTRKTDGEKTVKGGIEYEGEFDSSKITMKRWADFEKGIVSTLIRYSSFH